MSPIFEFTLLFLLLGLSAFFSGSETAIFHLPEVTIERLSQRHRKASLLKERETLLGTILFGNTLVNVSITVLATFVFYRLFKSFHPMGLTILTGIMTYLILVFGEFTPKFYGLRKSKDLALKSVVPLKIFRWLFLPVIIPMEALIRLIRHRERLQLSRGELRAIVESNEHSHLSRREKKVILSLLTFKDKKVKDVMTPKPKLRCIEASTKVEDIIIADLVHARIPVYEKKIDNIIGILYVKDLLPHTEGEVVELVREPYFVPETMSARILLSEFQKRKVHIAVVADEYGGVEGVVTLDDILNTIISPEWEKNSSRRIKRC